MGNENYTLHPETQLEQDIIIFANDILKHTNVLELHNLDDNDKKHIQIRFNNLFDSLSASGDLVIDNVASILSERNFYQELRSCVSENGIQLLKKFLDDLARLYQKIETNIQPNETRYAYALAAVLMNVGVLSSDLNAANRVGQSTSLRLEYAKQVQDKISDIISFTSL